MNIPDLINGGFEVFGGLFILNHCRAVLKDKSVAGVSIVSTAFFTLWGAWNNYFYMHLDQILSFAGGLVITFSNMYYVYLLMKYKTKETKITL